MVNLQEQISNIKEEFPLISFICPVYNDGDSVEKAIESIFDQDWPAIEVIAVNDCSPDNAGQVLDKLAKKHKNLKVIHFEKNQGACVARNEGAKVAKGKYYAWLPADAKLYPGMARVWVETLERFPDYDFLYGGYKFIDEQGNTVMNYMSEPFNPYLLECANYIDGSFPVRAEAYWRIAKKWNRDGVWDPSVKSLQDWDFWLSFVRDGSKGFYYGDLFFETTIPHPGGLSYDSHQNWLARTRAIKIKHGIPLRKICVTAPGAPFFAKYVAQLLDADYREMPPFKDHDYDLIYLLGFYPSIADTCAQVFIHPKVFGQYKEYEKQGLEVPLANAVKVVHLIGTDILQMSDLPKSHLGVFRHFLNGKYDHVFTEFKETHKEVKEMGIENDILYLPPRYFFEPTPLPEKFTVAVYAPKVNQALYSLDLMKEVAKKLPKVNFKFFGGTGPSREDNIEYVGYVNDMREFIKDSSCLMRITTHDGLPQSVLEFLSAGRRVIFNHDFKFVNTAEKKLTVDALVKAIKEEMSQGLNVEAAKYIRKNFSKEKFKEKIYSLLTYDPKKYWEQRAEKWILQASRIYGTNDWEAIKQAVERVNPKSVIDIGCGDGQWSEKFTCDYLGIDISEKLVKHAQKKYPDKKFIASSLEDYTDKKKFDLAFCYTTFLHIPEQNMEKAVESLKKLAKKAILVEPVGIETRYYQHDHNYNKWFTIERKVKLGARTMMLVNLER